MTDKPLPPGLENILRTQAQITRQQAQSEAMFQSLEDSYPEIEEKDHQRLEHLEAAKTSAKLLDNTAKTLQDVSVALQGVHERLDTQSEDSKNDNKKNRKVAWLSFGAGALAALAAIGVPFLVPWMQNGG